MVKIAFICAAGSTETELIETIQSFEYLVYQNSCAVQLSMIVILNNGSVLGREVDPHHVSIIDINPKANRSIARNIGIEEAIKQNTDYIIFIDAGDYVHPNINEVFDRLDESSVDLIVGNSLVNAEDIQFIKQPRSIYLKNIVNPFYLGSVLVHRKIYQNVRFGPFPKEDWRFWIDCLAIAENVSYNTKLYYQYNIHNVNNHILRKSKLIFGQFKFFRERHSIFSSAVLMTLHYLYLIIHWGCRKIWS